MALLQRQSLCFRIDPLPFGFLRLAPLLIDLKHKQSCLRMPIPPYRVSDRSLKRKENIKRTLKELQDLSIRERMASSQNSQRQTTKTANTNSTQQQTKTNNSRMFRESITHCTHTQQNKAKGAQSMSSRKAMKRMNHVPHIMYRMGSPHSPRRTLRTTRRQVDRSAHRGDRGGPLRYTLRPECAAPVCGMSCYSCLCPYIVALFSCIRLCPFLHVIICCVSCLACFPRFSCLFKAFPACPSFPSDPACPALLFYLFEALGCSVRGARAAPCVGFAVRVQPRPPCIYARRA